MARPYDNRDIVEKYIYHKLLKRGYVWEFGAGFEEVEVLERRLHRVLREAGDEIERTYQRDFAAMSDQLQFTASNAQRRFTAVIEELFRDGVNWGRIVVFFEFGGTLCVDSVNREMAAQVDNIARWMTDYLNGPLQNWIRDNGGWDAFVELYSQRRASAFHPWPYLKTVFGLAALGAAGVTIGALFSQK
ncbi:apoptosis regulator Bcl-2a [Trichomycterus rosablanca]|uniref:apoptosis regulator Bcl-2a n=1 Tax=Trichomycterus rosablanca TaxID=2290929 RepID=UPI002F35007F